MLSRFGLRARRGIRRRLSATKKDVTGYWSDHNVTSHHRFATKEESLDYFHWRNDQYFNYIDLMPVAGFDRRSVLDFGCGPGHDLVGFGAFSSCSRLVGVDLSPTSIAESRARLALHGIAAETLVLSDPTAALPFADHTFDHVHCSGVLHHVADPLFTLRELKRVLKPAGTMNVMVYNYESLWLHLYVAYLRTIVQGLHREETLREQFRHSTDGENCPISNCYRPAEWLSLCEGAGLAATFAGAAVSVFELSLTDKRWAAIADRRLPHESRQFLTSLEFDDRDLPMFRGSHAGIDAVYRIARPDGDGQKP
jgi:SAM-dependent methyltransferase